MREAAFEMISHAKTNGYQVAVCSSDSTDQFERYLDKGADYIIAGEGEQTLMELIQTLELKLPLKEVQGIIFRDCGKTHTNAKRSVMRDLDSLPLPAWDLLDMKPYKDTWLKSSGFFSINMNTTRGCPFHCNWCAKPIYGNRYNSRSPEHVVREIKMLKEKFGMDHVWFCDDIFGLKPGWVKTFADLVEKEKCTVSFKIQSRVDLLLHENNIEHLHRAGCEEVWVGAESGSQKILDAMDKGTRVEQIYESTHLLKKVGIRPSFFLQFGYPGETREDINKTIQMVMDLLPYDIGVSVSYPLPGTLFYENVKNELKEKSNWTDSDELKLMFRNTYPAGFYKILHRYIHKSYRTKQSLITLQHVLRNPNTLNNQSFKRIVSLPFYLGGKFLYRSKMKEYEKN